MQVCKRACVGACDDDDGGGDDDGDDEDDDNDDNDRNNNNGEEDTGCRFLLADGHCVQTTATEDSCQNQIV